MILVDKQIKQLINNGYLISAGYIENNLNGVSYDLTIGCIIDEHGKEKAECEIEPGGTLFIKTAEALNIPHDILGRVAEKNSRMRQGLKVDGPHYQPGHKTFAFLRVQNISTNIINLQKGMAIAQIIFEELKGEPEVPYDSQVNASFQNESDYVGLGNYKKEYESQMKENITKANQELDDVAQKIYGNVLALMGILVAVFSLLTINADAFRNADVDYRYVFTMNVSMALSIVLLMGIILIFLNKARNKFFLIIYSIVLIALLVVALLLFLA